MKKFSFPISFFVLFFVLILGIFTFSSPVFAHDLLPKEVVEYLNSHPSATPEEIKNFAQGLDPSIAQKFAHVKDFPFFNGPHQSVRRGAEPDPFRK